MLYNPQTKKVHPIVFILFSCAAIGLLVVTWEYGQSRISAKEAAKSQVN